MSGARQILLRNFAITHAFSDITPLKIHRKLHKSNDPNVIPSPNVIPPPGLGTLSWRIRDTVVEDKGHCCGGLGTLLWRIRDTVVEENTDFSGTPTNSPV